MIRLKEYLKELYKPRELSRAKKNLKSVTSVDTRNDKWMVSLPDLFGNYGFKKVGSGKYASVFINPKYKYAVKVFMKDAAYLRWIDFAIKNQKNPYVPKIRGKVVKITPLVYAIRLEKLTSYSYAGGGDFMKAYSKWKNDPSYKSGDSNIDDVLAHFEKNKRLLDIHGENLMMRGKQVVVIDPYYNWFGKKAPGEYMIDPNEVNNSLF